MGSHNGAKICELVGIYILSHLTTFIKNKDGGLYREDGLIILQQSNEQQKDGIKNIETWKSFGFKIEIMTNLAEVDFLDATFDLKINTYRPHRKPNNTSSFIHMSWNHPPEILERLPTSISKLLSRSSPNKQIFGSIKLEDENNANKLQRKRKIIWFNPLFSKSATTWLEHS